MKKYIYLSAIALAGLVSACNDDYVDKFDIEYTPTDTKNADYTLTAQDYGTIASNSTNQELALAKDPEGKTGVDALNAVRTNKYFTEAAPADEYIPALLAAKYPNANLGSKFNVTYNTFVSPSEYLKDLTGITTYTLTTEDYKTVWGDKVEANFLSPNTLSQLPALLAEDLADAKAGDKVVVNYAYSATEPSIGGGKQEVKEPTWTQVTPMVRSAGSNWNYVNVGPVDLSAFKGQTVNIGFKYASTTEANAKWEFQDFRAASIPYVNTLLFAEQEDGTFKKLTRNSEFKGAGKFIIAALWLDGKYYPFGRIASDKSYGYCTPSPITVTDGVIAATDATDFVVSLEAGATEGSYYIKNVLNKYFYNSYNESKGYYYNSFNVTDEPGEAGYEWTVKNVNSNNDQFVLTNTASEYPITCTVYNGTIEFGTWSLEKIASFDYLKANLINDEADFKAATTDWSNNQYGWVVQHNTKEAFETMLVSPAFEVAEAAVAPYFTVDEAFRYAGNAANELTYWVSTDYANTSTSASVMRMNAAGEISATDAVLYTFDGTKWSAYTNSDAKIAVFGPQDYNALGSSTVSSPEYVLPNFLAKTFPYAEAGTKAAVIYKGSKGMTASEFTLNNMYAWEATPEYTTETTTFALFADGFSAKMDLYYYDSLLGSKGNMTVQNVTLGGTLSYVWSNTSSYGWKASAYASKKNNEAEAWLVTPLLNLKKATQPLLKFQEVHQYLSDANNPGQYLKLMVSANYNGDVEKATWTEITSKVQTWSTNSDWNFVECGPIDLSEFNGSKIVIAFVYTSDSSVAPTWEIKEVKIAEATYTGN